MKHDILITMRCVSIVATCAPTDTCAHEGQQGYSEGYIQ